MTSLLLARESGHAAADAAAAHAEAASAGWKDAALRALSAYAARQGGREFLAEDVRQFAIELGLVDDPVEPRAWGAVMLRGVKEGFITQVGYAPAVSSRGSPKVLWKGCVRLT